MTNPNDRAQPFVNKNGDAEQGLTKLEFFAAMAMRGILGNKTDILSNIKLQAQTVAEASSEYAKALINELNKAETENGYSAADEQPF